MNIALIYTEEDPWAFGMRSIAATLKTRGHQTIMIVMSSDEERYTNEALNEMFFLVSQVGVIGVSCFSRGSEKAKQILNYLKPLGKFTIWGGVHATLNPEECSKYANVVCRGEGEGFILDILATLVNGGDFKKIQNAAFLLNGQTVINDLRPVIDNLDELPLFDFSFENEFHLKNGSIKKVTQFNDNTLPILYNGSRGCAFHCNYCANAKLKDLYSGKGRFSRKVSVAKYINNIISLREIFPNNKYFYLIDEDFMARKTQDIKEFSENYRQRVGIPFECMASPLQVSEEKLKYLIEAGLWRIYVGVESGSDRTKSVVYNRNMPNESVMRAAIIINKFKRIIPHYFFIIGNPYENENDLLETIDFITKLPQPFLSRMYNLIFLPGSILYEMALRDEIISGKKDSAYEMNILGGFKSAGHAWKSKNFYLNALLYLMEGKATRHRLGLIPRFLIGYLINYKAIELSNAYPSLIRSIVKLKLSAMKVKGHGILLIKRILKNPQLIHKIRVFAKSV